jgi:DNA polymerase-3 subunit delta'
VRVRPLANAAVESFLVDQRGIPVAEARRVASLAQGAIGRALGFLPDGDQPGPLEQHRRAARALLEAATSSDATRRFAAALATTPAAARGGFSDTLDALGLWIRDLAAVSAGAPELVAGADALPELEALARRVPDAAALAPRLLRDVAEARTLAYGNVNPQLILVRLLRQLSQVLSP